MGLKLSIIFLNEERDKMNAEDFIELAEYLKENSVPKDGSLEIELYRVLSSIEERLSDIAGYLKILSGYEEKSETVFDIVLNRKR